MLLISPRRSILLISRFFSLPLPPTLPPFLNVKSIGIHRETERRYGARPPSPPPRPKHDIEMDYAFGCLTSVGSLSSSFSQSSLKPYFPIGFFFQNFLSHERENHVPDL